jgi:hypothetical protein
MPLPLQCHCHCRYPAGGAWGHVTPRALQQRTCSDMLPWQARKISQIQLLAPAMPGSSRARSRGPGRGMATPQRPTTPEHNLQHCMLHECTSASPNAGHAAQQNRSTKTHAAQHRCSPFPEISSDATSPAGAAQRPGLGSVRKYKVCHQRGVLSTQQRGKVLPNNSGRKRRQQRSSAILASRRGKEGAASEQALSSLGSSSGYATACATCMRRRHCAVHVTPHTCSHLSSSSSMQL